ncbi:MAG TPA: ACR family protein [Xanthomonadales bacterium]|nr:ACR family protein [Xanthomonadales bacterium]
MLARYLPGLLISLACLATTSCAQPPERSEPWVELKGARFLVEIAADDASRSRGLMFRTHMDADRGMLFLHDREEPQAFWMRNTRIPLDILYFDRHRRLVSASLRTPPCAAGYDCPAYPSRGPALFTLELNAGVAERLGVVEGDELVLGPGVPSISP